MVDSPKSHCVCLLVVTNAVVAVSLGADTPRNAQSPQPDEVARASALIQGLRSSEKACIETLRSIAKGEAVPIEVVNAIAGLLADKTRPAEVKVEAVEALTRLGPTAEPALPALIGSMEHHFPTWFPPFPSNGPRFEDMYDARGNPVRAFRAIGEPAVAPLAKALSSPSVDVRLGATIALAYLDRTTTGAWRQLASRLTIEEDRYVRIMTISALQCIFESDVPVASIVTEAFHESVEALHELQATVAAERRCSDDPAIRRTHHLRDRQRGRRGRLRVRFR